MNPGSRISLPEPTTGTVGCCRDRSANVPTAVMVPSSCRTAPSAISSQRWRSSARVIIVRLRISDAGMCLLHGSDADGRLPKPPPPLAGGGGGGGPPPFPQRQFGTVAEGWRNTMAQGSIATLIRRTRQCDFNIRPSAQPAEPSHSASTTRSSTHWKARPSPPRCPRPTSSRTAAPLTGAPRGLHCGMGACFDCVVTVDGRIGQRACMTKVADGMVGHRRRHAARWRRSATNRSRAQAAGAVVRRAGRRRRPGRIVGRDRRRGGRGIGRRAGRAQRHRRAVRQAARRQPRRYRARCAVPPRHRPARRARSPPARASRPRPPSGAASPPTRSPHWSPARAVTFRPRRLMLAPGAHERPVPLPGWTLPGVMTTGSLQTLVRAQRVCPGERVLIAGSGPLNLQLACELLAGGVKPLAVVEAAPRPGPAAWRQAWTMARTSPDLMREGFGMLMTLKRAGVPVLWSARVKDLSGDERVQSAHVAGRTFDRTLRCRCRRAEPRIPAGNRSGARTRREAALRRCRSRPSGERRPTRTAARRSPGVFAVGDGASLGGSRVAMARGRLAGLAAARDLGLQAPDEPATRSGTAAGARVPGCAVDAVPADPPAPRLA